MPNPFLATVSGHVSSFIHQFIYSFPTPNVTTSPMGPDEAFQGINAPPGNKSPGQLSLESLLDEPGETRAMAGGVGPLSFAGSGYGLMLVFMALLLNRIHHIVRRPRPPVAPLPHPPITSRYHRVRRQISRMLVHPSTPRYLRVPGLIMLVRAWILFSILTLQVAQLWPVDSPYLLTSSVGRAINSFGKWAGNMQMEKVCWQVFLSVCAGLVCSALANGLDRARRIENGAGFNLFGYSLLLHLYSSPLTHHRPPPAATQGRPDIHPLFQLWLSLTELTWLQAVDFGASLPRNQLLPTAVCGTMGLTHFVYALTTSPLKFPSFTFVTHLMALFLSIIIILSIVLKAFTHLFTLGYLPSPVFINLLPHEGVIPSVEDDFGVVLLKMGTACIEASQLSGLRNELAGIEERQGPWVELSSAGSEVCKARPNTMGGFATEINEFEVTSLEDPGESSYWREYRTFWKTCAITLVTFIWSLIMATPVGRKAVELAKEGWERRWWYGPRQFRFWRREAWREPIQFRLRTLHRRAQTLRDRRIKATGESETSGRSTALQLREQTPEPMQWREILRGEVEVEDDEADWEDDACSTSSTSSAGDDEEDQGARYRDLMVEEVEDDLQPVLLAHMTNASTPLTRRRYAAILSTPTKASTPSALTDVIQDRRMMLANKPRDDDDADTKRCCVVCYTESRNIVFFPCMCLAVCNDCRDALASRLPAGQHLCPCCRRKVEGYSRIYIP